MMDPRDVLQELVDAILENGGGQDIDAGCNGDGPLAQAMVYLGMAKDADEATDFIFDGGEEE